MNFHEYFDKKLYENDYYHLDVVDDSRVVSGAPCPLQQSLDEKSIENVQRRIVHCSSLEDIWTRGALLIFNKSFLTNPVVLRLGDTRGGQDTKCDVLTL